MNDSLTICLVSYRSASLLDLNLSLTRELNHAENFHWLIVDNNGDFPNGAPQGERNIQVIPGDPCVNQGRLKGSYHHAQALNKGLESVSTRFLLVLDPDFFIFRRDWVKTLLAHMIAQNLSFFGAPYYPDLTWKRRYFPTVSCMLIDLEKVGRGRLDFTPELDELHILKGYSTSTLIGIIIGIIPPRVKNYKNTVLADVAWSILRSRWVAAPLSVLFPKRFSADTNFSRDTGFKIQDSFSRDPAHKVEMLVPAYVNDLFTKKASPFMNISARMYALLVPESLSLYPRRLGYSTHARFKDVGLFDVRGRFGWEEFFWQGKPFAMHIKGGTQKIDRVGTEDLRTILFQLAGISPNLIDKRIKG